MSWIRATAVLAIAIVGAGCASGPARTCRPGEEPAVKDSMYFGTARPGGAVTAEEWRAFLNEVVTPRFPQGLSSWAASGQWQSARGHIEHEPSYILHIVHPDTEENERAIREVVHSYKTELQQDAVLRLRSTACISF